MHKKHVFNGVPGCDQTMLVMFWNITIYFLTEMGKGEGRGGVAPSVDYHGH